MEVSIGVQNVARELVIETDMSPEDVTAATETALGGGVLRLVDTKGKQLLVPGAALAWVQIGAPERAKVGFGKV